MVIWKDTPEVEIPSYEKIEGEEFNKREQYEMIKLDGLWYGPVTDRNWSGEDYGPVYAYKNAGDFDPVDKTKYSIEPVEVPVGDPDEDGEFSDFETIGYIISDY